MGFLEYAPIVFGPGLLIAGIYFGRRQLGHRHIWTPWSRIWDEAKSELTKDQERFCKKCGFREEDLAGASKCPPHRWGEWKEVNLTNNKVGQQHNCLDCGYGELGKLGYPNS